MSNALRPGIDEARLDRITRKPLPGSRRVYVGGSLYPFLTQDVRDYATKIGIAAEEALDRGLEEKSAEFLQGGGELYRNA